MATPKDIARVRRLHKQGLGRNAIARETGLSAGIVSRIAKDQGLTFDRAQTQAATEAKVIDAKARRAALALALLDDAARLREQLWQSHTYWDWGGKDHTYDEITKPEPTPTDKLKLMQAVGTAVDRAVKLDDYDADPGTDAARSMLDNLAQALGDAANALDQATP